MDGPCSNSLRDIDPFESGSFTKYLGGIHKGYSIFGWVGRFSKIGYSYARSLITIGDNGYGW